MTLKTAVLIPCYNEEKTVQSVIELAKKTLPGANVYVYDNNSTDDTAKIAAQAGAIVRRVSQQGKGSVIRRMFADIDADIYVITDGDMTYDLAAAPRLIDILINEQKDMVVGTRKEQEKAAYPMFHRFGNMFLTGVVRVLFGIKQTDMLSGLRVFSKRFVKTFTARSNGFEIETELNVFTAMNRLPFAEAETRYFARPEGSVRKLSTIKDGFKVLFMIFRLLRSERPLLFYFTLACIFAVLMVFLSYACYLESAPYCPGFLFSFLLFCLCVLCGILFDSQLKIRRENSRLSYMSYPFPDNQD